MKWYDIADILLPPVYREIRDMYEYAKALNAELLEYLSKQTHIRYNCFVQTCDLATIEMWEGLLGITLYGAMTLEERRQNILLHMNNRFPYSEPYIRAVLESLFGITHYTLTIDTANNRPYHLTIEFLDTSHDKIKQFNDWFLNVLPAHIRYDRTHIENSQSEMKIRVGTTGGYVARSSMIADSSGGTISMYYGPDVVSIP